MPKNIFHFMVIAIAMFSAAIYAAPSELQSYVQQCQTELKFNASDVKPMNCNDGVRFAGSGIGPVMDFLVYQKINDTVDLAAACRWIDHNDSISSYNSTRAASLELIIHNRQNGETCFFQAKDIYDVTNCQSSDTGCASRAVSTAIVSPTNFNPIHSSTNPNADDFWLAPTALNNKLMFSDQNVVGFFKPTVKEPVRCVGCHAQGPFISSYDIARYLGQFGLLNNRHDTYANMSSTSYHYHVVGSKSGAPYNNLPVISAFQDWDSLIAQNDSPAGSKYCATCHALADKSTLGSLFTAGDLSIRLLPSISSDIEILKANVGGMPPYEEDNHFRWINLDTPGDGSDKESFADALNATDTLVPTLLENCAAPGNLEAHAVGVNLEFGFSTTELSQLPDRLRTFNLKEGLVCLNSDQESGKKCNNYAVRYICSDNGISYTASPMFDHSLAADGDHEERSKITTGICSGGINPIAIEATVNGKTFMGPNDRLARLSPYGLTCNSADQPDKKCSNYVVRYSSCFDYPLAPYQALVSSSWSSVDLTATGTANNAPVKGQPYNSTWNTQQWIVEPITNTEYVRIKRKGTTTYLNVTTQSEGATVVTYSDQSWDSEKWIVEPVPQSDLVRFKNLWSGRYLTLADQSTYSAIYSQSLNTSWASQKWSIN